ncbi:unnamed protein product [Durusdinium trenchii]|uniref:Nucleotide-diphospho-sugar transferase domain-containing protein n=1 Tax=Durusdinium trenchii TaxID=1381693 RepID=A0ABP0P7Z4_9DINO
MGFLATPARRHGLLFLCLWHSTWASSVEECVDGSVELLQRHLRVLEEDETDRRLQAALPMFWLHIPKCGTTFVNTLINMHHFCPSAGENFDLSLLAPHECFNPVFAMCQSFCNPNFLECYEHPSAMHSPVGNATEYARRKGKLVGFFRQPEQRVLSAYYDGHGWLEDFSNPDSSKFLFRCNLSYTGCLDSGKFWCDRRGSPGSWTKIDDRRTAPRTMTGPVFLDPETGEARCHDSLGAMCPKDVRFKGYPLQDLLEAFKGTMAAQIASPHDIIPFVHQPPRDLALGHQAVQRLREGFAFVGLTEEWDLSICLFHAMFGGPCHSSEFHNARPGQHAKDADGLYDTSILQGYQDEIDGLVYAEDLAPLGAQLARASGDGPLLVTWSTGGAVFARQALNLALSVRRHVPQLEARLVLVALDEQAQQELQPFGFHVVLHQSTLEVDDLIWKFRWQVLLVGLQQNLSLAVCDSDVVFFQDPFPLLGFDADLEIATEHLDQVHQYLWKPWVRPEDDLSTGFIYARPKGGAEQLLEQFLQENHHAVLPGRLLRDPFDQRVFNKFVRRKASECAPCIRGFYLDHELEASTSLGGQTRGQGGQGALRIRVLDPVKVFANGVNFFWRRAHLQHGLARPAAAHANGVGPKSYYMEDRQVWYVDDLPDRFGPSPRFLRYHHPVPALPPAAPAPLAADLAPLAAALEVAKALGRRLVLPSTLDCRNCPAYEAYGLNETVGLNCTPDYFAYMFRLYHVHPDVVPAGVAAQESFQALWPHERVEDEEVLVRSGSDMVLFSGDILALRDRLALGTGIPALQRSSCSFHEWPHRFMACRDEAYARHFGGACRPASRQSACGVEALVCCVSHHGRADRMQYYTGLPWDLPCHCGLPCDGPPSSTVAAPASGVRCCGERCGWAGEANVVPPAATNVEKDLPFASSSLMASFAAGDLEPSEAGELASSVCSSPYGRSGWSTVDP